MVTFHGLLAQWVGSETAQFRLPAGARLNDLLAAIAGRFGGAMPEQLWNEKEGCFTRQVVAFSDKVKVDKLQTPLVDGQEVMFMLMMGGG